MGLDDVMVEIGLYLRKGLRTCYRSVHKHPFIMGFVLFSFLLYRFLPFLFSFLISSSPVLVCTFALLGTLLSYGQHPDILPPQLDDQDLQEEEQEQEEKQEQEEDVDEKTRNTHHQISSFKAGMITTESETDHHLVQTVNNVSVETHVVEKKEKVKDKDWVFAATDSTPDDDLINGKSISTSLIEIENEPEEEEEEGEEGLRNQYQLIKEEDIGFFVDKREFHEVEPLIERANSDDEDEDEVIHFEKEIEEPLIKMDEEEVEEPNGYNYHIDGLLLAPQSSTTTQLEDPFGFAKKIDQDNDNDDEDEDGVIHFEKEIEEPLIKMDEEEVEEPNRYNYHIDGLLVAPQSSTTTQLEDPFGFAKKIDQDNDNDDDDEESFESDSDGAESSSPDASMTDIMPMLDELHPLLDTEVASQPATHAFDDAASEGSGGSEDNDDDDDNVDDSGDDEEEEEVEDNEEEGRQRESHDEEEENGAKGVVTWTEDDEKNLMDLGNSELERNRRLESLIARRWARKNMRMMEAAVEKKNMNNKIDLDYLNAPPFHIAPISTTRRNPFDIHYDSNMGLMSGLPPIPGSAPSVMVPRRNPFDLPYDDPLEERPDLTGGSFNEEFVTTAPHDKDHHRYFSRHESFNLASYYFGDHKQEKFRPYFVTEQMASEGSEGTGGGYSRFHRQLSEMSDSKVSSASETESHSSIANHDEHMTSEGVGFSRFHRQLSEMSDSKASFASETESHSSIATNHHAEHKTSVEKHVEHTPDNVILESVFAKEVDLDDDDIEQDVGLSEVEDDDKSEEDEEENANEAHSRFLSSEFVASRMEPSTSSSVHIVNPELGEIKQHSRSSSSSSSDVHEKIFDVNIDEELANMEPARGDDISEFSNMQPTVLDSDVNERVGEAADDSRRTEEPVYDLSPSASAGAIFGMTNNEEALCYTDDETLVAASPSSKASGSLHLEVPEVEGASSLTHGESSLPLGSPRMDMTSSYERSWAPSPELCPIDEHESTSTEITNIGEHDIVEVDTSDVNQHSEECVEYVLPLNSDAELIAGVHQSDVVEIASSSDGMSPKTSSASEQQPPLMEKTLVHPSANVNCEESQELFVAPEIATEDVTVGIPANEHEEGDDWPSLSPLLSVIASLPSEVPENQLNQMVSEDKGEMQYDNTRLVFGELDIYQEAIGKHVTEEEFVEETEDIGEIDEAFLTELDAVGDFSFEELEASPNQSEKNQLGMEMHGSVTTGLQVLEAKSIEDDSDKLHKLDVIEEPYEDIEVNRSTSELLQVLDASSSSKGVDSTVEQVHDELLLQETEDGNAEFALPTQEPIHIDTELGMPVLEAKSLEDIDSAFRQLHERVNQKPIVSEPVHDETNLEETIGESAEYFKQLHDELHSKENENDHVELEPSTQGPNLIDTDSEMPVLEAKSLEDIQSAFRQLHERENKKKSIVPEPVHDETSLEETIDESAESFKQLHDEPLSKEDENDHAELEPSTQSLNLIDTDSEMPVLEAKSIEDIDSAFRQLHERESQKKSIVSEPVHGETSLEETIGQSAESFKQLHDEPLSKDDEDVHAELEPSTQGPIHIDTDSGMPVLEAKSIEDIDSAFRQLHERESQKKSIVPEPVHDETNLEEEIIGESAESFKQLHDEPLSKDTK